MHKTLFYIEIFLSFWLSKGIIDKPRIFENKFENRNALILYVYLFFLLE